MTPDPAFNEILFVLQNLSDKSRFDVFGATILTPHAMARMLHEAVGCSWVFYHDEKPCALLGAMLIRPGVWNLYGMGTDDWRKVWREVTLVAKTDMMQQVLASGAHRAQCVSPASHEDTHKWLRMLGATHEAELPAYGNKGEDFIMFSWLKG